MAEENKQAEQEPDFEIELVDAEPASGDSPSVQDTAKPPEDKPAPPVVEAPLKDEPDEDELKSYSERVQARISKLSAQRHAERRKAEALERQIEEAANIFKSVVEENNRLKQTVHQRDTSWKQVNEGRLSSQLEAARAAYKQAYESGDAESLAQASADMATVAAELDRTKAWTPQPIPPTPMPPDRPPAPPRVDERAVEWQRENNWFGVDSMMTGAALGVHQELVNKGFDPQGDAYYDAIDKEMHKRFPEKFNKSPPREVEHNKSGPGDVVAGAARTVNVKKKIQLNHNQQAIAKKFGLTNEQYAQELAKLS